MRHIFRRLVPVICVVAAAGCMDPISTSALVAGAGASAVGAGITAVTEGKPSEGTTAIVVGSLMVIGGSAAIMLCDCDGSSAYLETQRREVKLALARGAGPYIVNVTDELGAPAAMQRDVGRVLRAHRSELAALVDVSPMDQQAAADFGAAMMLALQADPVTERWASAQLDRAARMLR